MLHKVKPTQKPCQAEFRKPANRTLHFLKPVPECRGNEKGVWDNVFVGRRIGARRGA